jgi:hypothetical protein
MFLHDTYLTPDYPARTPKGRHYGLRLRLRNMLDAFLSL